MLYSLSGKLIAKKPTFAVVEANGIGFKIFISSRLFKKLPPAGSHIKIFCSVYLKKDGVDFYGFLAEKEKELFELVNSAPGIGPKSALAILDSFSKEKLFSAINEGRSDLVAGACGVGPKKAERLILELRNKIKKTYNENNSLTLKADKEIEAILKNLGYKQSEIGEAIKYLPEKAKKLEERLKLALKFLSKR